MVSTTSGLAIRAVTTAIFVLAALPSQAADHRPVRWHIVGIVSGLANPHTTEAYFPRPLSAGELIDFTITIDPAVPGNASTSYAMYPKAITSVVVSGSDWTINMKAPLADGNIQVANDNVDYGDMLALVASTAAKPGKTWFQIDIDMRNPGGPSPGVGPWQPFTSLALPKTAPALGSFPNTVFYLAARRDVAGQELDGAAYFGTVLSIDQVGCH